MLHIHFYHFFFFAKALSVRKYQYILQLHVPLLFLSPASVCACTHMRICLSSVFHCRSKITVHEQQNKRCHMPGSVCQRQSDDACCIHCLASNSKITVAYLAELEQRTETVLEQRLNLLLIVKNGGLQWMPHVPPQVWRGVNNLTEYF